MAMLQAGIFSGQQHTAQCTSTDGWMASCSDTSSLHLSAVWLNCAARLHAILVSMSLDAAHVSHHARGGVVRGNVVRQVLPGELLDVGCRAQDRPAQRAVLECSAVQMVKHHLIWHALHLQPADSPQVTPMQCCYETVTPAACAE